MSETGAAVAEVQDIWVGVIEGAEITGYHPDYVRKLARDNWKLPEDQRAIKLRRVSSVYIIWLPSLVAYTEKQGYGPQGTRKKESLPS